MQLDRVRLIRSAAGTSDRVAWSSPRSRVSALCFRAGEKFERRAVEAGQRAVLVPEVFGPGEDVTVIAHYDGAPPRLVAGAAAAGAPETTAEQFRRRQEIVDRTWDAFMPHRQLFVEMDRQTHLELLPDLRLDPGVLAARERAIAQLTRWLWRSTLRRGGAYAYDLSPLVARWAGFDADVVLVSKVLHGVFEQVATKHKLNVVTLAEQAFAAFANGELAVAGALEQGGPDGPYYALFAAFAMLAAATPAVPEAESSFWRELVPSLVATLEVFEANYRAPADKRLGRPRDFSTQWFAHSKFSASELQHLLARYRDLSRAKLDGAFDRWSARVFAQDILDLGG